MSQVIQRQGLKPSDEANEEQIRLANKQGEALQEALKHMTQKEAHGGQKEAGDYVIAWANEKAEGMYMLRDGQLEWQEPQGENTHLEVAVCSAADGRFIPGLTVHATLVDRNGKEVGTHRQEFLWHPWLYHYGRNWQVPDEGPYTLRVRVDTPDFPRHDKTNGKIFTEPVEVEFQDIRLELGKK